MQYLFSKTTIACYALLIAVFSFVPFRAHSGLFFPRYDYFFHGITYFLLSFLLVNGLALNKKRNPYFYGFVYSFLYGFFIEIIQFFLPFRSFETKDILINLIGALLGCLIRVL
ncbi:MAG: VanZ family protein [Candidatus Omnitrophota bacterium]